MAPSRADTPLLELEDVHADIGQHHILQGVSLAARRDAVTVLLGRNGAGKTTTLRTVMGLIAARRGDGAVRRRAHRTGAPRTLVARLGIGYVPEGQGIFGTLTVDENLRVAQRTSTPRRRDRLRRVFALFPDLGGSGAPGRRRSRAARSRCWPSRGRS